MRDHDSDEHLIWGWVIPRGGKKKPVILDRDNFDEISAITEEEIHGLGYFPLYSSPVGLSSELDRLRDENRASKVLLESKDETIRQLDAMREAMEGIVHFSDALNFREDHLSKALRQWIDEGRKAISKAEGA